MATTEQQKLTNAYNEFICDYVEAHGQNQATRDEAHERAAWCVELGQSVVGLAKRFNLPEITIDWMIEAIPEVSADEAYLVGCAVAVAKMEAENGR